MRDEVTAYHASFFKARCEAAASLEIMNCAKMPKIGPDLMDHHFQHQLDMHTKAFKEQPSHHAF